MTTGQN